MRGRQATRAVAGTDVFGIVGSAYMDALDIFPIAKTHHHLCRGGQI